MAIALGNRSCGATRCFLFETKTTSWATCSVCGSVRLTKKTLNEQGDQVEHEGRPDFMGRSLTDSEAIEKGIKKIGKPRSSNWKKEHQSTPGARKGGLPIQIYITHFGHSRSSVCHDDQTFHLWIASSTQKVHCLATLSIIGPSYGGFSPCIAGFWTLKTFTSDIIRVGLFLNLMYSYSRLVYSKDL